tara:strand:+ start:285 stop:884 length:600 start_codon:yes stop_codon:yes gene_type:complete
MENNTEILELIINEEDDDSGISFISLVDQPATEKLWLKFNKQQPLNFEFKIQDEEKRIVSGYFMVADLPIPRLNDLNEKFFVVFKKDTINKIVNKFFKQGYSNKINLMHDQEMDGVYVIESLIIDNERGSIAPKEFEKVPNGSWWGSMRVENNEVWELVKNGNVKGFSVEGMFGQDKSRNIQEKIINKIRDVISNYKKI